MLLKGWDWLGVSWRMGEANQVDDDFLLLLDRKRHRIATGDSMVVEVVLLDGESVGLLHLQNLFVRQVVKSATNGSVQMK